MGVEEFDTQQHDLGALGHRLERLGAPTSTVGAPTSTVGAVVWRLVLTRPGGGVPTVDAAADAPIDIVGSADGAVPAVLATLLAGVTGGAALHRIDGAGERDVLGPHDSSDASDPSGPSDLSASQRHHPARSVACIRGVGRRVPVGASVDHLVRAMAVRAVRTIVGLDPHLRLDALADDVHDARVAARRLRSELHSMAHVLRVPRTDRLRNELAWYGDVLGAVRDLDFLLEHVAEGFADDDPGARLLRIRMRNQRRVAAIVLRNALTSTRMRGLYDELLALVADPWFAKGVDPDRRARRAALAAVRDADRRLARSVRAIGDPPDPQLLREVRKRAKACRYVCELVAEPTGSDRLAAAMKALQTALGALQDAATIDGWLGATYRPVLEPAAVATVATIAERVAERRMVAIAVWPASWVRAQSDALRPWLG
ncbi:MAG: CHAD domain-containing protein [Actinomycetes bacterium]